MCIRKYDFVNLQLEALMPGTSVIPSGSNQGAAVEIREQEKNVQRQESRKEKRMSRWDRHSPCESGRGKRRRHRSRSRSLEQRERYGRSRSRSNERSDVSRKRRWEEKPSTPVVSQVCVISYVNIMYVHVLSANSMISQEYHLEVIGGNGDTFIWDLWLNGLCAGISSHGFWV